MSASRFQGDGPADHVACQPASDGTASGAPRAWLRAEAAVLLAGALAAYSTTGQPWWLVPALILLPDLAWAGYLGLDHLLGYGLKHDDSFQHTHLGMLGRKKEAS